MLVKTSLQYSNLNYMDERNQNNKSVIKLGVWKADMLGCL